MGLKSLVSDPLGGFLVAFRDRVQRKGVRV